MSKFRKAIHAEKSRRQALTEAGICHVCQCFGTTGWRRQFQLQIHVQHKPAWAGEQSLNIRPYGRTRGWFLPPGHVDDVTLTCIGDREILAQLAALLCFLEKWGSLGSRPQLGYGLFQIVKLTNDPGPFTWEPYSDDAKIGVWPDLRTFTFFKLHFTPREGSWWTQIPGLRELRHRRDMWRVLEQLADNGMVPVTPALKNYLRFEQRWSSTALPHWFFGTLRGDQRLRSKLALSWAYRLEDVWEIRGWAYLPQDKIGQYARNEITTTLQRALGQPQSWFQALGVQGGYRYAARLTCAPEPAPWQLHTNQQVATFLNTAGEK